MFKEKKIISMLQMSKELLLINNNNAKLIAFQWI